MKNNEETQKVDGHDSKKVTPAADTEKSALNAKSVTLQVIGSPFFIPAALSVKRNISASFHHVVDNLKLVKGETILTPEQAAERKRLLALSDQVRFETLAEANDLDEEAILQRVILHRKRGMLYFWTLLINIGLVFGFAFSNLVGVIFSIPILFLFSILCIRENYYSEMLSQRSLFRFAVFMKQYGLWGALVFAIKPLPVLKEA